MLHAAPAFRVNDTDQLHQMVEASPLASLVMLGDDGFRTAHAPLVFSADRRELIGHLGRGNAFWKTAERAPCSCLAIFRGPDGYISPSFYPAKQEHGRVVPTWNYLAVEVQGVLSIFSDPSEMQNFLEPLVTEMECDRTVPWAISDAPDEYIEQQMRGIIGMRLTVEHISGVRKLSQNKTGEDYEGVVSGLEISSRKTDQILSNEMRTGGRN